ncbi:sugar transporter domain-containing protein [Phthorimaea operculella]|nr:sugar transporter domain-containing protein [Phthorimaea operculella]
MDLNKGNKEQNECPKNPEKPSDISSALENVIYHMGDMGTYQRLLFAAMMPFGVCWAFVYFGQMFLTATPQEHWCIVPELQELSLELRRNLSIPGALDGDYDHCNVYDANWTLVLESMEPPDPGTPIVPCQHGWEFEYDDIPYPTVASERGWVCGQAYLVPLSQTLAFVGSIFGGILCGTLADKIGRVPVLVLANLLGCIGGVATMFTNSFWDFAICRFIVGMACDSLFLIMYILVLEYVGIKHRTWVANMAIAFYFGTGCLVLPWIAWGINDWRYFSLAISAPMLFVLLAPFCVPESTRWLVSKGRIDKAVDIFRRFEKINRSKIPKHVMDEFVRIAETTREPEEQSIFSLFKSLRKVLVFLVVAFMTVAVAFDSLARLSETLGLDFFVTFTVMAVTEIPSIGLLVVLLDRFGRRMLVFLPMTLAGILALVTAFLPRGVASVALATIARFFANMAYGTAIQWGPELLPTVVRASGASFVHMSGFVALTVSPFIVFAERAWEGLPMILVAILGLVGGSMALFLPETKGRAMPQTMEDWEDLVSTRPYKSKKGKSEESPDARNTNG